MATYRKRFAGCAKSLSSAQKNVEQIFDLPYRRFVIGRTFLAGRRWQVKNLRYSVARRKRNQTLSLLHWMEERRSPSPRFSPLSCVVGRGRGKARDKNRRGLRRFRPILINYKPAFRRLRLCCVVGFVRARSRMGRGRPRPRVLSVARRFAGTSRPRPCSFTFLNAPSGLRASSRPIS